MNEASIFAAALERSTDQERTAFLAEACAGDDELRRRVEAMLDAHAQRDRTAEPPAQASTDAYPALAELRGTQIGPYKLLQQIGEGGFGVVYMAEQSEPVRRFVAVKIIKPGMDTREVIARFESERQALALMDHPHIAKVLDAGTVGQAFQPDAGRTGQAGKPDLPGRPYFVMELVKGVPITEFCDKNHQPANERLKLFIDVCHAIQHAHHKGVIHRDIKPSNVMVTLEDGLPMVKVIDFGVAKAIAQKLTEKTLFTAYGQMVGTPAYMSPEQAERSGLDIDTRSDIYSLGVLLYELLTGTTPLESKRLRAAGYTEMQRMIREEEPQRPSQRLSSLGERAAATAGHRRTDPKQLARLLAADLDWVVMKALEKDRNRRYGTPGGFAEDIERYLKHEAIVARPPSASYKLRKFAQRNRAAVVTAGLVLSALLLGILGTTFGLVRADQRRIEAEKARAAEAKQRTIADAAKKRAEQAEAETLADYRASTDDAIEQLIGSKPELGPQEKTYLEKTLARWQTFTDRQGDDERSRAIGAEGHYNVGRLWQKLGRRDEARADYERALATWTNLTEQHPDLPGYELSLARCYNSLAALLAEVNQRDIARRDYAQAKEILKKLIERFPDVPATARRWALVTMRWATCSTRWAKTT
ncbi:MAG TPA: serine/threonine-protein kinase [Pirellulales bacterium]|jgi:serine/threonine protein kinase|nr:serine/threonine-protein kinase [Pirellulales bacterium]